MNESHGFGLSPERSTYRVKFFGWGRRMAGRYLIIGTSGFISRRLWSALGSGQSVGTYHSRPVPGAVAFDATTMRLADAVLRKERGFTHAFILHGVTGIDECARDPRATAEVNVAGTKRVIDDLLDAGIVPVFASSDAVFEGSRGPWSEGDPTNPVLTYGRQKVEVERYLLAASPRALIVRPGKVVEPVIDGWMSCLSAAAEIRCATDQVLSPVAVDDAVRALIRLAEGAHSGIFHVAGPRAMTRLELLQMLIAQRADWARARVVECSLRDFDFVEPRPLDCSMSADKLNRVLGGPLKDMEDVCRLAARAFVPQQVRAHGGSR